MNLFERKKKKKKKKKKRHGSRNEKELVFNAGRSFIPGDSFATYNELKNGSLLLQWGNGNRYQLHQVSSDRWLETFEMAVIKESRVEHTFLQNDWTSVTVNGRPKDKAVEVTTSIHSHHD